MNPTTLRQGQVLFDPNTGKEIGNVQFDSQTGKRLSAGQTTLLNPTTQPRLTPDMIGAQPMGIQNPPVNNAPLNNLQTKVDTVFTGTQTQGKDGSTVTTFSDGTVNSPMTTQDTRAGFAQTLRDTVAKLGTKTARTNEIQQEEGVQDKKTELRNIETEAMALDKSFQKRIDALLGSGGMTREQAAPQVQELQRMQNSQKADLAIRQRVAQGNYTDAFEIAQAKVEAEFAPYQAELDSLKMQIDLFQNDMTESEKVKANQAFQEKQDALDFQRQKELYRYKSSIDSSSGGLSNLASNSPIGALVSAANSIAASLPQKGQRELFLAQVKGYSDNNNPVALKDYIFKTATSVLPTGEGSKFYNRYLMTKAMDNLQSSLGEFYSKGGNTSLINGTKQQIIQKLGKVGNPELYAIGTRIANSYDELARYRTGAALTTGEEQFYRKLLPSIFRSKEANEAGLLGLKDSFVSSIDGTLGFVLGSQGVQAFLNTPGGLYSGSAAPSTNTSQDAFTSWLKANGFQ